MHLSSTTKQQLNTSYRTRLYREAGTLDPFQSQPFFIFVQLQDAICRPIKYRRTHPTHMERLTRLLTTAEIRSIVFPSSTSNHSAFFAQRTQTIKSQSRNPRLD